MPVFADLHTGFGKVEKRVCECVYREKKGSSTWRTGSLGYRSSDIYTHPHHSAQSCTYTLQAQQDSGDLAFQRMCV